MVPIMRLFRNLPALFALVCAATGQGADSIYRKVGDSVVLNPGQPFNAISSATWKHNTDLASEWFGTGNVDCYRDFKDRCSLNKKDGSFTISNLKVEDSGIYTPEINDKVLNALKLQVIKPVPKPTVSVKCNNEKTRCNLTCEANISADVGTVTYEWRTGEEVLSNNKELIITENKESSFICELENRVSSSSSDGVDNPISSGNPGAAAGLAAAIVILIVAAALAVIGRFGWYWFKNRKFPTWKEFWCCGKKKAKGNYAESAEGKELLHDASEKSDLEAKIYKDQETNAMRPTETLQIVNENGEALPGHNKEKDETNISGSAKEPEEYHPARETLTSEGEASPIDEKKNNLHQKPALNSFSVNQGDFNTGEPPFKGSGMSISGSCEEPEQNPPPVNSETRSPTNDEASPSDEEKDEESSGVDQGDSSTAEQPLKESDSETNTNNHGPNVGWPTPTVQNGNANKGEAPSSDEEKDGQDKESAGESSIVKLGEQHLNSNPNRIQQPNDGTETNISGSGEEHKQNHPAFDAGSIVPTEDKDLPNNCKKTEDQHQKSAEKSPIENHGDSGTGKQLTTASGTNISVSSEKDDQFHLASDPVTSVPTEGEASPSYDKKKDEDKTSPGANEKADETNISVSSEEDDQFHPVSDPVTSVPTEGEASSRDNEEKDENNKVGDDKQGKQPLPGVTNTYITAEAEDEAPPRDNEEKDDDETSPRVNEEKDGQDEKSALKSSSEKLGEQHVDSKAKEIQQPTKGTKDKTSPREEEKYDQLKKSALKSSSEKLGEQHVDSNPEEIQLPAIGTNDETSPRVNEEKDGQDEKSALKSSSEKLGEQHVDSKAKEIQQPTKGTNDETSPRVNEEKDGQDEKSALKSSSEKLGEQHVDSNPEEIQLPAIGTKNTSVEPSGPETSEEGSTV